MASKLPHRRLGVALPDTEGARASTPQPNPKRHDQNPIAAVIFRQHEYNPCPLPLLNILLITRHL